MKIFTGHLRKVLCVFLIIFLICFFIEAALRITGYLYLNKLYAELYAARFNNVAGGNINIVCLGESSTAGIRVDWQDSYPKQLERKLRKFYGNLNIRVIVPPHVGQNTSQVSNRIKQYSGLYKPKLVILMIGCNNTWSFAESHITRFLTTSDRQALKVRLLLTLDNFRIFKVLRYSYLRFIIKFKRIPIKKYVHFIFGYPEYVLKQTKIWTNSFADLNKKAFVELWKYDVRRIIQEAKRHNIEAVLMTYHINPMEYLSIDDFVSMANEQKVFLVRNDIPFDLLIKNGTVNNFLLYDDWHPSKHWHPNKQGYTIIANNVFKQIKDNNLLDLQ